MTFSIFFALGVIHFVSEDVEANGSGRGPRESISSFGGVAGLLFFFQNITKGKNISQSFQKEAYLTKGCKVKQSL